MSFTIGWNILPRRIKYSALCAMHLLIKLLEAWILPAFTTSGIQASRWKDARKVLSRHQASFVQKQALYQKTFETITPINLQLDKAAAIEASRLKEQQERNRQILYRIIDAQYDPVLKEHFQNSPRNAIYVSNTIQNELIAALYQNTSGGSRGGGGVRGVQVYPPLGCI